MLLAALFVDLESDFSANGVYRGSLLIWSLIFSIMACAEVV